jgi:GTP-binding protein EngB required for normal cell division
MTLADYERRKFELSEILRALSAARPRPAAADDPVQPLMARLAEDRFNLVVVGRFSRGKSSLMNAILETDRLPTGVVPLTSVITAVGYGSDALVRITYEDRLLQVDAPLEELRDYVTEEGNPGNRRRVKLAEIQLPSEILRRGFYFIDTPGLGSAILQNTQTTEAFLPAADAVLLVTGFESPLSVEEDLVLQRASASRRPLFVAVNKMDMVSPEDREASLAFVRRRLCDAFGDAAPEVFPTSATEALLAKQHADDTGLEASGVASLEAALIRFLVTEKSRTFLLNMCERIEGVLWATPGASQDLHGQLRTVRAAMNADATGSAAIGGLSAVHPEQASTCAICTAIDSVSFDFLAQYQYQLTVDPAVRQRFTEDGGFCPLHAWRYNAIASPHGICLSSPPLTETWVSRLASLAASDDAHRSAPEEIRRWRGSSRTCPACRVCAEAESAALAAVGKRLQSAEAVDRESAFCLGHLPEVIEAMSDPTLVRALLQRQAGLFERVSEDMRRYALKFEAIRRPLASRTETASPARALRLLAGVANLSTGKPPG